VVLDAAVRSWPPLMARCLRWVFPVWMPADDLDPARLRSERPKRRASESKTGSWTAATFVQAFIGPSPRTKDDIARAARDAGLSGREAQRMLRDAESSGLAHRWYFGSNVPVGYATVPQADSEEVQP